MPKGGAREGAGRNPGSPNKGTAFIRSLAGAHAEEAVQTLVSMMQNDSTPAAARVSAAKELLERGFGRSSNLLSVNLDHPLSGLTPEDAMKKVTDLVTGGQLPVEDGTKLTSMIEARMKAVELADIESRLNALEQTEK